MNQSVLGKLNQSVLGKLAGSLAANGEALCAWVTVNEPAVAEWLARESFDAVALDMQHGAIDLDGAMRAYAEAYRLRPTMFGTIAMALTSAPHGRLWLDEAALRRSLSG